jgi:PEP-CTERM motif
MKRLLRIALGAVMLAQPGRASAQLYYNGIPDAQEYLDFMHGSGVGYSGVQVGPYEARFIESPATPSFNIYCVDYNHHAVDQWVNVTSLGSSNLSNTRLNDATKYQKAAYLSSLFDTYSTGQWGYIHAAIWYITSGVTLGSMSAMQPYLNLANTNASSFNTAGWYVLSPTTHSGIRYDGQEFLMRTPVSVPEPATVVLLATGLLLMAAFSRRRLQDLTKRESA